MRFFIIYTLIMLITGCAVNDTGLVSTRYFENKSSYLATHESWGGYLSTRQADGGVTLGHTVRIMVYPKPGNKTSLSIDELLQQPNDYSFDKEIKPTDIDLAGVQPYAWANKSQGVMFHLNSIKNGVSLGLENLRVIRLPVDFNGIAWFSFLASGAIEAAIQKTSRQN